MLSISATLQSIVKKDTPIGVVGLGYVGLPLACLLAEKFKVVGFDINQRRVDELTGGHDRTNEVPEKARLLNSNLVYTTDAKRLAECAVVIVAVPTPVDQHKKPDLTPVQKASETVGKVLRQGMVVVYESTVYPGLTEQVCGPILEKQSGLTVNRDFYLGYSPERVNPGDRNHTIEKIVKVVSGSTPEVTDMLCQLYGSVIKAGVHRAPNIRTAEAAKVIENTQRDLNIALVNELAMLFERIGLDTQDVLEAAGTKWNFLPFRPGLVGGHCIGVDPYYLTYLADGVDFNTRIINSGRRINDGMGGFVARKTVRMVMEDDAQRAGRLRVAILGATFKEDIPDLRNSKVVDVASALEEFGAQVHMIDPHADADEFEEEYGRRLERWDAVPECDAVILAVKHAVFMTEYPLKRIAEKLRGAKVLVDIKGAYDREAAKAAGLKVWRL